MKIRCKSLLVSGRRTISANSTMITQQVSYDMTSVRSHEFNLWVYTNPNLLWRVPLLAIVIAMMLGVLTAGVMLVLEFLGIRVGRYFSEWMRWAGDATVIQIVAGGLYLLGLIPAYLMGSLMVEQRLLEKAVRKERNLPQDTEVKIVTEGQWDSFLTGLK